MTQTTSGITEVALMIVPVADQDRAVEFYAGTLGLQKTADFRYADDVRWVEVTPPGGRTRLSLVAPRDRDDDGGLETGVVLATKDADAEHARLRALGADVGPVLRQGDPVVRWAGATLAGVPAMFLLRDPDGNSLLIVQA